MTPESVREALKHVIDPELGVNIVDLGLVYDVVVEEGGRVRVRMTMTSPACPLGSFLTDEVRENVRFRVRDAGDVDVDIVWQPRWRPEMMSPEAKAFLGWTGDASAAAEAPMEGDR